MKKKHNFRGLRTLIVVMFLIVMPAFSFSQNNPLEQRLTVSDTLNTVKDVLTYISDYHQVFFTYSSNLFNTRRQVDFVSDNELLKDILTKLINDSTVGFKSIENHIVFFSIEQKNQPIGQIVDEVKEKQICVTGKILDLESHESVSFASVSVLGQLMGTVSNENGEFVLKIPENLCNDTLIISYLGYQNYFTAISGLDSVEHLFYLKRNFVPIQEVIIRNEEPKSIVRKAIESMSDNYSAKNAIHTCFYREAVNKRENYLTYFEAIIDLYKLSYHNSSGSDKIKIIKSRKSVVPDYVDSLSLKLQGGLRTVLYLDIVKNQPDFLNEKNMHAIDYCLADIEMLDKDLVYVVDFKPKEGYREPFYKGRLYVDIKSFAILGAEFIIPPERIKRAQSLFVVKKKRKVRIKLVGAKYYVNYKKIGNKHYLNHVRADLNFKIKRKKELFYKNYHTYTEMGLSKLDTVNVERIPNRERVSPNLVLSELSLNYDYQFWESFNIIKPEESLREALKRMKPVVDKLTGQTD